MPENIIFFTQNNGGLPIIDPKFIVHLTRNATRKRGKYILVKDIFNELCILVSYCCPLSQFYFKSSYTHSWLLSPLHYLSKTRYVHKDFVIHFHNILARETPEWGQVTCFSSLHWLTFLGLLFSLLRITVDLQ